MAKLTNKSSGNSRIRFVMLEADLGDGDLTQITQAISNALRQGPSSHRVVTHATTTALPPAQVESTEEVNDGVNTEAADIDAPRAKRGLRKFPTPKVLADVDLNTGDVPFEAFAKQRNPSETLKRYLLIAYWFKTYRDTGGVTRDHVYTCYKKMGWGTDIRDFAQAFRDLERTGRGSYEGGEFRINHIGEDVIAKMAPDS